MSTQSPAPGSEAKEVTALTRRGIPVRAEDWTEQDWLDLHRATERVIRKIAKRHKPQRH